MEEDDLAWTVAVSAATIGSGVLARKVLAKGWDKRRKVPAKGADTTWREAFVWTVVSGLVVAAARLVTERGMAAAKARRTGRPTSRDVATP